MVPHMTYFGQQKVPKICLEQSGKKLYKHANREGFAGSATWQIKLPRVMQHGAAAPSMTMHETPL
jgi:hypothetical protein